jgi:hypothetical protein
MKGPRLLIAGGVLVHPGGQYACAALAEPTKQWCEDHIGQIVDSPEAARAAAQFYAEGEVDAIIYDAVKTRPVCSRKS